MGRTRGWQNPYSVQHSASLPLSGPGHPPAWSMSAGSALIERSLDERRALAPEWCRWTGAPSCACSKATCISALGCQQESHALQEGRKKGSIGVRVMASGVRYCDRRSVLLHSINPFFVMEVSQGAAPRNALTLSDFNPDVNGWHAVTNN